ncbi:MAG TPA: cytochrome c family protein, partial [Polyangiaceae bacterium LLY-WYZ-15_(1-7)]|nr:cytochrome c family protein [Polyangiaceae bacterium LLY-WYZ-15_(1-7)]
VNEHNREALADRAPPPVEEGQPRYVGSGACASCHQAAHTWWEGHPHGNAYATLVERNKQFHLNCVGCHVTGYERPGGSTVTQNLDGALVNVGCEVCHGPGSAHVANPVAASIARDAPERLCVDCHNEEHSDLFDYDAYRASLLVPGHGRPE